MHCGKAAGESNIYPEMLKVACERPEMKKLLLDLLIKVWEDERVPKEWALMQPLCPFLRRATFLLVITGGELLSDVVGKIATRIIQRRSCWSRSVVFAKAVGALIYLLSVS